MRQRGMYAEAVDMPSSWWEKPMMSRAKIRAIAKAVRISVSGPFGNQINVFADGSFRESRGPEGRDSEGGQVEWPILQIKHQVSAREIQEMLAGKR